MIRTNPKVNKDQKWLLQWNSNGDIKFPFKVSSVTFYINWANTLFSYWLIYCVMGCQCASASMSSKLIIGKSTKFSNWAVF